MKAFFTIMASGLGSDEFPKNQAGDSIVWDGLGSKDHIFILAHRVAQRASKVWLFKGKNIGRLNATWTNGQVQLSDDGPGLWAE